MLEGKENDFQIALSSNLVNIRKDMEKMREQTAETVLKLKKDEKMVQLAQERDWFRAEAVKLNA